MRIQHNIAALNSYRNFGNNNNAVAKSLEKLSSGYRINKAGDDAAILSLSEKMRAQIKGLESASTNAENGISLIQVAEGALTEVHSMLNRMTELATQAANGSYGTAERQKIQDEVTSLTDEIDRISNSTDFNGTKLLDGTLGGYSISEINGTNFQPHTNGIVSISITGGNLDGNESFDFAVATDGTLILIDNVVAAGVIWKAVDYNGEATLANGKVDPATGGTITYKAVTDKTVTSSEDAEKWVGVTINIAMNAAEKDANGLRSAYTHAAVNPKCITVRADGAGAAVNGLNLQVGDTNDDFQKVNIRIQSMSAQSLQLDSISVMSQEKAGDSIQTIKNAVEKVSTQRGQLGALQNRLDHTINYLGVTTENMAAAESRIRDVDMAKEMMDFTKNSILAQAAQTMLVQANQLPKGVLQLVQ